VSEKTYKLRSEDLDDFLDGLSGGLACSIIVHIDTLIEANLGKSLKEAFALLFNASIS